MNPRIVRSVLCCAAITAGLMAQAAFAQRPARGTAAPRTARAAVRHNNMLARHLEVARDSLAAVEQVSDYTATFSKRELVDGALTEEESLFVKIRHEPFSAYVLCLGPVKPKGQEVIYIEGANNGEAWAHTTGI